MRIKVKTLKTLVFAGILVIGGIFAGGMISKKVAGKAAYGETEKEYCCGDIVFGEGTNDASKGSISYNDATSLNKICKTTAEQSALTTSDFTLSCGAKTYAKEHSGDTYYPLKLGASGDVGNFTITLKNFKCDKVIVYAGKYSSDDSKLTVNGSDSQTMTDVNFNPYVYEFSATNSIVMSSVTKSKGRVYISKIVLRLSSVD